MHLHENTNKLNFKTILLFCGILFVAYLPISSFLFSLKNDAFTGYFPPKFFMSESIHSGTLPLWNPYINFGIPQYGDMSSGFWSPITWLIASTIGYNAYTFSIELLLYILIGAIGLYKLLGYWNIKSDIRFIAAVSFMCSGFNIGHLQHFNWISGAAFLPWSIWAYLNFLDNFSTKNVARLSLIFYFLVSSAHPGISISAFYLFLTIFIFTFIKKNRSKQLQKEIKKTISRHAIFIMVFLLLSAGMIAGYVDILPHFARGEKLSIENSLSNPTSLQSWISAILPFATVKNDLFYNTDISMRNCYFSLTLLLAFIAFIFGPKTKWQLLLLAFGFSFSLLSLGGVFKTIGYKLIPGISFIRLNGEFRIFTILCFIIVASIELNKFTLKDIKSDSILKKIFLALTLILICTVIYAGYNSFYDKISFLYNFENIKSQIGFPNKLKKLLDSISFYDTLWIQGTIQIIFLLIIKKSIINRNFNLLKKIVVVELIFSSLLNMPFTGVGKASLADVQTLLNESKKGIPIPTLMPISKHDTISKSKTGLLGNWSMYSKEIGTINLVAYPILLNNTVLYFDSIEKNNNLKVSNKPYLYIADNILDSNVNDIGNTNTVQVKRYTPCRIDILAKSNSISNIFFLQNHYPHWFYKTDEAKREINKAGINFMSAPLKKGDNNIVITFEPSLVRAMIWISLFTLITLIIILLFHTIKRIFLS